MTIANPLPDLQRKLKSKMRSAKRRVFRLLPTKIWIRLRIRRMQRDAYGQQIEITAQKAAGCRYTAAEEERIAYYLGGIGRQRVLVDANNLNLAQVGYSSKILLADYQTLLQAAISGRIKDGYTLSLLNLYELLPASYRKRRFLYYPGDHGLKGRFFGLLAKARQCDDPTVTLLNLNPARHWRYAAYTEAVDRDYRRKKGGVVWRGAMTGRRKAKGARRDFVKKFSDGPSHFDVGFTRRSKEKEQNAVLFKDRKTIKELLQYKLLVSLEGNDVASGLKWMLRSNSVVMMPEPTVSSWLMEEKLEPFVHYIPLAHDFSDAEEQFHWAMRHEEECMSISRNASEYMTQFMDPRRETLIECAVFQRYLDNIDLL